jgi:hypothetical protein
MILRDVAAASTITHPNGACAGAPGMGIASRAARAVQRSTTLPTLLSNKLSYGSDPLRSATPISGMARPPFSGVVCVRASLCSDTVMTRPPFSGPTLRTTIAPSKSSVTIISPLRAAVRYRLDPKRIIAAPMRIAPGPAATGVVESLGDLVAWRWRSGVQSLCAHRADPDEPWRADDRPNNPYQKRVSFDALALSAKGGTTSQGQGSCLKSGQT